MAAGILLGLLAAMALGVALVWLGMRGRRINRNPSCRWCGFDLSGAPAEGVTCPECGAGLKREGAVRIGQRRRMWGVAAVGAGLVLAPGAAVVVTTYAIVTGANVNEYKPLGLLLWEARHGAAAASQAAANEVLCRRQGSLLSEKQALRVLETALDIQGDPDRPWCEEWGDFVEMSRTDGIATDEHYERFTRQAALIQVETRPQMCPGDPLPVVATLVEARIGSGGEFVAVVWITDLTLNGQPASDLAPRQGESGSNVSQMFPPGCAMFMLVGSGTGFTPGTTDVDASVGALATVSQDATPGPATVGATLTCRVEAVGSQTGYSFSPVSTTPKEGKGVSVRQITAEARIVPPGTVDVELISPTEEFSERLAEALIPETMQARSGEQGLSIRISFPMSRLPVPIACDVFWRIGEQEWMVGSLTSGAGVGGNAQSGWITRRGSRYVSGSCDAATADGVELVLKPNPHLALGTADLTSIYGGEIVITNDRIKKMGLSFEVDEELVGLSVGAPSGG